MNSIKRFFRDEAATAEATSTVIMIAAVGLLLAAGLGIWYSGISSFFTGASQQTAGMAEKWPLPGAS